MKNNDQNEATPLTAVEMQRGVMPLHLEILGLLKKRSSMPHEYINPHFLAGISTLIEDYYDGCEDEKVDKWIMDMFEA